MDEISRYHAADGAPNAEQSFPPETASVGAARRFVRRLLSEWGSGSAEWNAELAVSELATNCVLHAATAFTVTVTLLPEGAVRLEVADGARRVPKERHYAADTTTGRGVALVAQLTRRWGVDPQADGGKVVWCEIAGESPDEKSTRHDRQAVGRRSPDDGLSALAEQLRADTAVVCHVAAASAFRPAA